MSDEATQTVLRETPVDQTRRLPAVRREGFSPVRLFADNAAHHEHHVARKPPDLAEIVRCHHDLDAGLCGATNNLFDAASRRWIEARSRLIKQ